MREYYSVREWQKKFKSGAFENKHYTTQMYAGWHDWFCGDGALAGRLKRIAKVVTGITEPFILDNYYVWFKNNCPVSGPLYDDVRFEPLSSERDGKYFIVTKDSPHEKAKWVLHTERHGFDSPEYECGNVRDMIKYINNLGRELSEQEQSTEAPAKAQKRTSKKKEAAR